MQDYKVPFKSTLFYLIMASVLSCANIALAQTLSRDGIWQIESKMEQGDHSRTRALAKGQTHKAGARISLQANMATLKQQLAQAPALATRQSGNQGASIYLPGREGEFLLFEAFESQVMQAELAKRFPQIKTYKIFGVNQKHITGVMDMGPRGFHAMIHDGEQQYYIDPDLQVFHDYARVPERYLLFHEKTHDDFECHAKGSASTYSSKEQHQNDLPSSSSLTAKSNGDYVRKYRLAVSTSGEYAAAVSSNSLSPDTSETQAAIVTAINRVNEIYNRDLAIQLELVDNNDQLIFLDKNSDPYQNNVIEDIYTVTQTINDIIGNNAYDIGHLFLAGSNTGGLALLASTCGSSKAAGVTGVRASDLQTDFFYVDYVAHEIGHQFAANHSFNATSGFCGGINRNAATAWEPGSGSSIMAYAGLCEDQNIEAAAGDYFHSGSIEEILTFSESTQGSCYEAVDSGDNPPWVNAGPDYNIPRQTPFILDAEAGDVDSGNLYYSWEQMDTGSASNTLRQMNTDDGTRPLFRSYPPSLDSRRFFPRFEDVLNATLSQGEVYPATQRALDFRITVRSNNYGINYDDLRVNVIATNKQFAVRHPDKDSFQQESGNMTVAWETADTQYAPVACAEVDILFSISGSSNPDDYLPLKQNVANNGQASVTLPGGTSASARLLLKCSDNIFYALNPGSFSIIGSSNTFTEVVVNPVMISENASPLDIIFRRTGELGETSQVNYEITGFGKTPTQTEDFISGQSMSGTIFFTEGEDEKRISLGIQNDTLVEGSEDFRITISNPVNSLISKASADVTIIDDDKEPDDSGDSTDDTTTKKTKTSSGLTSRLTLVLLFFLALSRKAPLLFMASLLLIQACAPYQDESKKNDGHPFEQALRPYQHSSPEIELKKNLAKGDARFLAFHPKGAVIIPGLTDEEYDFAYKHGYRLQEGMGDLIVSEHHLSLRQAFYVFASDYNQLLLKEIGTGK